MAHNLPAIQQKAITLREYLHQPNIKKAIEDALPKWLSPERFLRVIFTATMKNPKIVDCSPESILQSVMQCAQLGLEPILGRAYLIPYNNSKLVGNKWVKVLECQFQPGYQGLIDLARRTNVIRDIYAMNVFENDEFDLTFGTDRKIHHRPWYLDKNNKRPGEIIGVYAVWEMKDGTKHPEFMPISDVYKRRDKSQAYQYAMANPNNKGAQDCPWLTWPEEMIIKTVIKHSSKLVPASIDFMQAVALDEAVDLGKSQMGMFTDTPEYNGLLPESSGAIDISPKIDEKEEDSEPKTSPAFAALIKEQAGMDFEYFPTKDGIAHDKLSAYLEFAADHQAEKTTPYEMMEMISAPGVFPGFWNGFEGGTWKKHFGGKLPNVEPAEQIQEKKTPSPSFNGHRVSPEGPPPGITIGGDKNKSINNQFDAVHWESSKMAKVSLARFWEANKAEWNTAEEESKVAFEKKWILRFTENGSLTLLCPWKKEEPKQEEMSEAAVDTDFEIHENIETREPGDELPDQSDLQNQSTVSGLIKNSGINYNGEKGIELFAQIQIDDPGGLINACEAIGYGKNMVVPLSADARKKLHEKYLELKN